MPYINDRVLDNGLAVLTAEMTRIDICSQEPATYTEATSTYSLGSKTGIAVPSPVARIPSGRKVVVPAVLNASPGNVTANGTATHHAGTDPVNSRLLVAGALNAAQPVTAGNTFTTSSYDVSISGLS